MMDEIGLTSIIHHLASESAAFEVGELAQLGERLLCTQEVSGSIPLFSTTLKERVDEV